MERTESTVIQVAPSYENAKIKEMERFGWRLMNRQEIHEEGDSEGHEAVFSDTYVIKTKIRHYVKLHFSRDLSLPNLDKIKALETEYNNLQFPSVPTLKSFLWPAIAVFCGIYGLSSGPKMLAGGLISLAIGALWAFMKIKKWQKNSAICKKSLDRRRELVNQAGSI